jgi:hypothetical protein
MNWDPDPEKGEVSRRILIYKHIHILAGWFLIPIFLAAIATKFK